MKNLKFILISATVLCASSLFSNGAVFLIDSFTSSGFSLPTSTQTFHTSIIPDTSLKVRGSFGSANGGWTAVLNTTTGHFNYTTALNREPVSSDFFLFTYQRRDTALSIIGIDSLVLNIVALSGEGELAFYFDQGQNTVIVPVPIQGLGEVSFSLHSLLPSGWNDSIFAVNIHFTPKSPNFSITVSEMFLAPEPSSSLMLALVVLLASSRRKRSLSTTEV